MYISDAVRLALDKGKRITRTSGPFRNFIRIRPTNTPACCLLETACPEKPPVRGWEPDADDLMADDWEIVD